MTEADQAKWLANEVRSLSAQVQYTLTGNYYNDQGDYVSAFGNKPVHLIRFPRSK